jgi:Mg2+-importing ATPase
MLVLAAVLAAFLGEVASCVIIVVIVLISVGLDFFNSYRSEKAAEKLEAKVRITTTVRRDGRWVDVAVREVVPGDAVRLVPGKLVPADGIVIFGNGLDVNESTLTGESLPVVKRVGANVYMGASVTTGSGVMEVTATGRDTEFAHIAAALNARKDMTEFDREMRSFSVLVAKITFGLVLVILAVNMVMNHGFVDSLLFALALAVGLTPELLPLIMTLNLTKGSLEMAKRGVVVKKLSAIQNFGSMDVLCTDKTGTLTENKIEVARWTDAEGREDEKTLFMAYLSCAFSTSYESPLDQAIMDFWKGGKRGWVKRAEVPFDYERRCESVVGEHEGRRWMIIKGAPEAVVAKCDRRDDGAEMTRHARRKIMEVCRGMSGEGLRVVAVATREVPVREEYGVESEREMIFAGFVAFRDPVKRGVGGAIKRLVRYGVNVKMITGDDPLVAARVAEEVGMEVAVVLGDEVDKMNAMKLVKAVEKTTIFARVNPEQKLRIIEALRRGGHTVGYIGDGVNDAPALSAADVSISVNNAVDVAKAAADLILMRRSLAELCEGVVEGRRIFANTLKYLMMALSSNFGNMFSMAASSMLLPFLPMSAPQILFNNLLYDASQFGLPTDNVDREMVAAPRKLNMRNIKKFMWVFGPVSSVFDIITFVVLFFGFRLGEAGFQTGWFIESLLSQTFVVYVLRTRKIPFVGSRPGKALVACSFGVVAVAMAVVFSGVGGWFGFEVPSFLVCLVIAGIVMGYLVVVEVVKQGFYRWVVRGDNI